jgi:hypothetical protein
LEGQSKRNRRGLDFIEEQWLVSDGNGVCSPLNAFGAKRRKADDSYRENSEGDGRFIVNSQANFAADLRTRGCAVCNQLIRTARDFFAQWQYALTRDEQAQSAFAEELGFCALHMWQLHSMSSPWGESVGLAALTEELSRLLAETERDEFASSNVHKLLRACENCRVCVMLEEAEAIYVKRLATFICDEEGAQSYKRSGVVCLRHLARMLAIVPNPVRELLLTMAWRRFEQVTKQMRDYAAKREAVRRDLISADEENASLRALIHIVGAQEYSAP